ncbi:helix-turn-helix domain-containing protein [Duganella sp. FT50W]|uniref:Helix-turn-helix domain-containing protein n=1 Tax=Duganella lactea TaxID=2692173 RepID=A0A6L8MU25_9BURK|nr:helix-turn-helix domain-containing protein [Duganella lactea]
MQYPAHMDAIKIGKIIAQKRHEKNLTQQELADYASVSRRSLIDLERGRNDTSVRRLLRVLGALGLQLHVLSVSPRPTEDQLREIFTDED